mgnify:CR=1 FL=1
MRRTKIIATLGPATSSPEILGQLMDAGMNIARLNMSHAPHDWIRATVRHLRAAAEARFARMDANGDGTIGADERGKGMGKWKRGGRRGAAAEGSPVPMHGGKRHEMKADANGDGVITRAEFDAHSAARFAAMDANKDGRIDASEMPKPRRMRGATPPAPGAPQGE